MSKFWLVLAIAALFTSARVWSASETQERNVDEAAVAAQEESIRALEGLLAKYRGTKHEPLFLFKLATIQQQTGAMQFRVAHGDSHRERRAVNLADYRETMTESARTLSTLISKFPSYEQASSAWFMRGRAYEEIGQREQATRDYLHLVKHYPSAEGVVPAYMSLAEFATLSTNHRAAVGYLRQVEKRPNDSHYAHALYKLSWAHYNLREIPAALSYAERLAARLTQASTPVEKAQREGALQDAALFFFEGFQMKLPGHSSPEALAYFRKLDSGEMLGKMILRYGKLLRANDHRDELAAWSRLLLEREGKRPETMEVLLSTYEFQKNKQLYGDLMGTAKVLARYHDQMDDEQAARAEKLLFETTTALQSLMRQYQGTNRVPQYSAQVASVYQAITEVVDEDDARVVGIHQNLAETLFAVKEYEQAAAQYRWIVKNGSWRDKSAQEASLKAIAARYESLKVARLVPSSLDAVALPKSDRAADPRVSEWIEWIDEHLDEASLVGADHFAFEANRVLYGRGQVNEAFKRLKEFSLQYPKSKVSIPSATLVVDTAIASGRWDRVVETADEFVAVKDWKGTPFSKRVHQIASDAQFKKTEALASSQKHEEAIEEAEVLLKKYAGSERTRDALAVAGNSALAANQRDLAIGYLKRLASLEPSKSGKVLLTLARIEEERYGFAEAARHYETYLQAHGGDAAMRKRVLSLVWLSGDAGKLRALASSKGFCKSLSYECERHFALTAMMGRETPSSAHSFRIASSRASHEIRGIHAAAALERSGELGFDKRHRMIAQLAASWPKMDPLTRFSLLPRVSKSIAEAFALDRAHIARTPLTANERTITRRIALIREMENAAAQATRIPSPKAHAVSMHEVASSYDDLTGGLRQIPAPAGLAPGDLKAYDRMLAQLTRPFEKKAQAVRQQEIRISARALADTRGATDLGWKTASLDTGSRDQIFRTRWSQAIASGNWAQVGYFIQQAEKRKLLSGSELNAAKAVSLNLAGTQPSEGT
ncbi:MAG TPA: tetratricopeptide repeat protein [Bdellovibrionota bacterium]|nr:tetratricopeptide repeat protein [Bdellovibrionota bacterium]